MHGLAKQAAKALKFYPNNNFYEQGVEFMYVKKANKINNHSGQ